MNHDISVTRNRRNELRARNEIDLGMKGEKGERRLSICTRKGSGGLSTFASVADHHNGMMSFRIPGDFSRNIINSPGVRATEKAIRLQHAAALAMLPALIEEVTQFYAKETEAAWWRAAPAVAKAREAA